MSKIYFFFSFVFVLVFHGLILFGSDQSANLIEKSYQVSVNPLTLDSASSTDNIGNSLDQDSSSQQTAEVDQKGIINEYLNKVIALIEAHKDYPLLSRKLGEEGVVALNFIVSSDGKLEKVSLRERSQFDRLNEAALKAISRVKEFPRFPKSLDKSRLELALSLKFLSR